MIEAKNLTKRFGRTVALNGITVKMSYGISLILGPNGGGKSTFLKLVAGVYRPTSGKVTLFGENPWRSSGVKYRIGVAYDPVSFPLQLPGGSGWSPLLGPKVTVMGGRAD